MIPNGNSGTAKQKVLYLESTPDSIRLVRVRILEMKVEVLYFEGCPNHMPTVQRVRQTLQSENETVDVRGVVVRTQAEAEAIGFLGSPSVRINGLDIEAEVRSLNSYGLSCRTYLDGATRSGVPPSELIRLAIKEQRTSRDSYCQPHPAASANPISTIGGAPGAGSSPTALFAGGIAQFWRRLVVLAPYCSSRLASAALGSGTLLGLSRTVQFSSSSP
jgi:hypothetical protein